MNRDDLSQQLRETAGEIGEALGAAKRRTASGLQHTGALLWLYRWHIGAGVGLVAGGVMIYFLVQLGVRLPGILVAAICTMAFIVGSLAFFALPYLAPRSAAPKYRHTLVRFYLWLVRVALYRGGIVKREHAGVDLVASKFDAEYGSERYKLGGEWKDTEDIAGRMNYWGSTPFFLTHAKSNLIVDPLDVQFGKRRRKLIEAGENIISTDVGECIAEHVRLPARYGALAIDEVTYLLGGSGEPDQREITHEFTIKSQVDFKSRPLIDMVTWVIIFGATLLVVFLAFDFSQSLDSGNSVIGGITKSMVIYGGWL